MINEINQRRKFLIVTPEKETFNSLQGHLLNNIKGIQLLYAGDGSQAQAKISNDPPNVIFIDQNIKKLSAYNLVEWIINDPKYAKVALIVMPEIPERELYVDEVLVGKLQFLDDVDNSNRVVRFANRALNFVASGEHQDFSIKYIACGEELIREGEIGESVFIVKSGRLEATHLSNGGDVVHLGIIEPGEFVGEMSFVNSNPRSASVQALTQCELIEIPMSRLDHLLFKKPAWSKALIATLTKRLEKANKLLKVKIG